MEYAVCLHKSIPHGRLHQLLVRTFEFRKLRLRQHHDHRLIATAPFFSYEANDAR